MKVLIRKSAFSAIEKIADYIATEIKMQLTAQRYADKLIDFGFSLGTYYNAYPVCRNKNLAAKKLRCATFDKKWVFAYELRKDSVVIHQIIWGGKLK